VKKNIATSTLVLASLMGAAFAANAQTGTAPASSRDSAFARPDYSLLPYTTRGYVGVNLGQSDYNASCVAGFSCEDKEFAWKAYTGGRLNEMLAIELGYINFGKVSRNGGNTEAHGVNLSLVGNLPLGEMAGLFAKVGTTYNRTDKSGGPGAPNGKEDGFGLSYGVGIGFNVTPQVQIVGEWERHRLDFVDRRDDVDMLSVGLRYRF